MSVVDSPEAGEAGRKAGGVMITGVVKLEVRDRSGNLLEERVEPVHSLVRNFAWMLYGLFAQGYESDSRYSAINTVVTDTSGASCSLSPSMVAPPGVGYTAVYFFYLAVHAASGNDKYGVLVGNGSGSYSSTDYKLASQIGNSVLSHSAVTVSTPINTGDAFQITISRSFTNKSGSSVTVTEVGLASVYYYKLVYSSGSSTVDGPYYIMLAHDFLSSPVTVPDGTTLTVSYVISIAYK